MKLLGSFLLDFELISAKDLADVMVEQIRQTPNSLDIIYERQLITPEQFLSIVSLQNDEHLDLCSACIRLDIWRNEFFDVINEEVAKRRSTLGRLLVEKGLVEPHVLLPILKQYHAYRAENNNDFALFSENTLLDLNESEAEESAPLVQFDPDFSHVQASDPSDYIDLFSEEKEIELELVILAIESLGSDKNEADPEELLNQFFTDYHSMKGTARSVGAPLTENLIHESEDLLTFFKRFLHKVNSADFAALAAVNLKVLDALSNLRNGMISSGSEEDYWQATESREKYLKTLGDIKRLNEELENRGYEVNLEDVQDLF
ncbi:Hpt domain-containing protein [Enterovibrio calviensis]|uniref:Hpt domain-containing protein n=1 Tax=Enterovibrio calviensis TaxID=91359 RepID=UPI00048716F9|nr:Hpt domain-containing protein [Enterovibrio calviensis]